MVRFKQNLTVGGVQYQAGEEAEVPSELARTLVLRGVVEFVESKRLRKPAQNRVRRPRKNRRS